MTSSVNGGPHKPLSATKPQGQWITTTRSSLIIDTRTFHHIVGTTFLFPLPKRKRDWGGVPKGAPPFSERIWWGFLHFLMRAWSISDESPGQSQMRPLPPQKRYREIRKRRMGNHIGTCEADRMVRITEQHLPYNFSIQSKNNPSRGILQSWNQKDFLIETGLGRQNFWKG